MKKSMIVVAGGTGTRMGAGLPKQFIKLNGLPILMHTLLKLRSFDEQMQLVLVLPQDQFSVWNELVEKHGFTVKHHLASGGATRFDSVRNGLSKTTDAELIGIHDGVRPFLARRVFEDCFAMAEKNGSAIPIVPVVQSLRKIEGQKSRAVNRDSFKAVQTPQCFREEIIKEAFENATRTDYSDDASVVESNGKIIYLVEGNEENIKITTPIDLELAQLIVARQKQLD